MRDSERNAGATPAIVRPSFIQTARLQRRNRASSDPAEVNIMNYPIPPPTNPEPSSHTRVTLPDRWSMNGQAAMTEEVVANRRRVRRLPLLDVLDDRFQQIFINEVVDFPHRAASGDSDFLFNTERHT